MAKNSITRIDDPGLAKFQSTLKSLQYKLTAEPIAEAEIAGQKTKIAAEPNSIANKNVREFAGSD